MERTSFEVFKSAICKDLKRCGDIGFLINQLEKNEIRTYYEMGWYPEAFYLLAMVDYISRLNNVEICTDFDDIRNCKLEEPLYPLGTIALASVGDEIKIKQRAWDNAIPEFKKYNIVEADIRNVV